MLQQKEATVDRKLKIMFGVLLILGAVGSGYVHSALAEVVVVVNRTSPVTAVKKSVLKRYFFKKTTMWDYGEKVAPIDLPAGDPVREEFSKNILGISSRDVETYWISESLIGGKSAPEVVNNSHLVKARVAANPAAIGYLNISDLDDSVKRVEVVD